jgi:hypothetical protein
LRRVLSALGGIVAGGLLAASGLFGASSSTTETGPPSEPLELDRYCRAVHGADATVYQPDEISGWSCSVWKNGVWGLEPLDPNEACRWQRGEDARVERLAGSERALACTL